MQADGQLSDAYVIESSDGRAVGLQPGPKLSATGTDLSEMHHHGAHTYPMIASALYRFCAMPFLPSTGILTPDPTCIFIRD